MLFMTSAVLLYCSKLHVVFVILYSSVYSFFFFFKQKTAYEMRISDWSSDVCSSDLCRPTGSRRSGSPAGRRKAGRRSPCSRRAKCPWKGNIVREAGGQGTIPCSLREASAGLYLRAGLNLPCCRIAAPECDIRV